MHLITICCETLSLRHSSKVDILLATFIIEQVSFPFQQISNAIASKAAGLQCFHENIPPSLLMVMPLQQFCNDIV